MAKKLKDNPDVFEDQLDEEQLITELIAKKK
jgi:hypothetical protein